MNDKPNISNSTQILKETIALIDGAYAPSTIRAYWANFERFIIFCETVNMPALPSNPETVAKYIQKLTASNLKSASIRIAVASISTIHQLNQFSDPTQFPAAKLELRRMHRTLGRSSKQAWGITKLTMDRMILAVKNDLRGLRDKALILLAYDSLCRRSELISLRIDEIKYSDDGLPNFIKLRKSKTDQESIGKLIRLTTGTQIAVKEWMDAAKIHEGFLFRGISNNGAIYKGMGPGQINRIYKKLAKAAQVPEEIVNTISGHSFRVGRAQDLIIDGATLPELMTHGRWSKPDTAMRYVENLEKR